MSNQRQSSMKGQQAMSPERQRLRSIRAFYRDMASWEKKANETLTLKQKADQREEKERELIKKYGLDK